jgi:hypothetical protein
MPFDVSGNFTRLYNWQTDRNNGIKILASRMDGEFDNFATGMNLVFFRDGRVNMSGTLGMGLNRMTGVADGSAANPSIKFNGDANSGPFLDGLSRYGIAVNATKRFVVSASGIEVIGAGNFTGAIDTAALNVNNGTLTFKDGSAVAKGKILQSSGLVYAADNHSFQNLAGSATLASLSAGTFQMGTQSGAAADGYMYIDNTNVFNNIIMRNWVAGVPTTYAQINSASVAAPALRLWGVGGVSLGSFTNATVLSAEDAGVTVSKGYMRLSENIGLPTPVSNGYFAYNSTNGLCLTGAGASYDVALFNKNAAAKLVINTGGELQLLGTPTAPTAAGGTNSTQIATTAFVMGAAFAPIASPTFTGTARYTASIGAGTSTFELGFRDLPPQAKTGAYNLVLADRGTLIPNTTGGWAIPANASVAFPIGTIITLYNDSGASQNVTITTDTLRLGGTALTGTRAVAQRSTCTLLKVNSTEWIAGGQGVS